MTDAELYNIENQVLDESFVLSLDLPKDEELENQILYENGQLKIFLDKIVEEYGQYEVFIEYIGQSDNGEFLLISPFSYDSSKKMISMNSDTKVEVSYLLDDKEYVREINWYSFQIMESGIRASYRLLYDDKEINLVENSDSFKINLVFKNLIMQRWEKYV